MGFEVFDRKARPSTDMPVIAIQGRGTISFNEAAFTLLAETVKKNSKAGKAAEKYDPGVQLMIEYLFDPEKKVVGFRVAEDPSSVNAYPLRKQANSASFLSTGKAFLKFYKIEHEGKVRRYAARLYGPSIVGFSLDDHQI